MRYNLFLRLTLCLVTLGGDGIKIVHKDKPRKLAVVVVAVVDVDVVGVVVVVVVVGVVVGGVVVGVVVVAVVVADL